MDNETLNLVVGGTQKLTATVASDDKSVQFSSSDTTIATVTPVKGIVTAVAAGTATITATTVNGKTATCVVAVTAE